MTPAMRFSIVIATYKRAEPAQGHAREPGAPPPQRAVGSHRRRQQLARQHARGRRGGGAIVSGTRCATRSRRNRDEAPRSTAGSGSRKARSSSPPTTTCASRRTGWTTSSSGSRRSSATTSAGAWCRCGSRSRRDGFRAPTAGCGRSSRCSTTGPSAIRFGARVPLGVNMAMRREAIERVGGFDTRIGRKAGTLLGQEVREWCMRATRRGPGRLLHPGDGRPAPDSARSAEQGVLPPLVLLARDQPRDDVRADRAGTWRRRSSRSSTPRRSQHIAGVPRYLFRNALVAVRDVITNTIRRDPVNAFERELWLWMFAGIVKQRWHDRQRAKSLRKQPGYDGAEAVPFDATVLICTYNRAAFLGETLDSLARSRASRLRLERHRRRQQLDRSDARGRDVARRGLPGRARVSLRAAPGQVARAQHRARARPQPPSSCSPTTTCGSTEEWVDASCAAMLDDPSIDYTGGPVRPIWEAPCPAWLDQDAPDLWGTLAILDYGPEPFVFEERRRVPLGANMAVRRRAHRSHRRLRSRAWPQGRLAAGPGAGRVLLPIARGRRPRAVRAGDGAAAPRAREAAHQGLLPPLVVLEGRLEGAARAASSDYRAGHRSEAGSDAWPACRASWSAPRFGTRWRGWRT